MQVTLSVGNTTSNSYVIVEGKSLSKSLSIGGSKIKLSYKTYGKYMVKIDGKTTNRTVWKYRNQYFIKRKNGEYTKISKRDIKIN